MNLRESMIYASEMAAKEGWPKCYYWDAVWWRLSARESKNLNEVLGWAKTQMDIYRDILIRQKQYELQKKINPNKSDYQIYLDT